ncbi:hypothetical protein GALMADRAFT_92851 [Galerina marginata CBS 339.88]|uniref:NAD(P)-binding domain-containing protein n=1 Tax=Galerina marginata (strain CBS 339.88) TaxID=685588 RepID=A0A067TND7_GALM3|nr:hypothetical protein GALMADRAFT_92851 [Galerina marginata CBS 339.88]
MAQNILVIGGSRHIGHDAALRFLDAGATATFLLRSPATFDNDEAIQKHVKSGKARLIKGDALVIEDVRSLWAEAGKDAPVDLVLFTVGFTGNPKFQLTQGFVITPGNLVTQCLLNVLCTMPPPTSDAPSPKIITLSTSGVSRSSRAKVPFLLKAFYGYLIQHPLRDKLGMERVIYHCAGWEWNAGDGEPGEAIMGAGWKDREGLPERGTLKDAMVLRPAALTDGECVADSGKKKTPYRAGEGEVSGWSVSRKDVAHFIFDAVANHWDEYGNKQVSIAY